MSEIKSEKAKKHIREHILYKKFNDGLDHPCVRAETAVLAVRYAETELTESHTKEQHSMQTAIGEGKEREVISVNILADKRKECERLEKELQKLIEVHNVDRYHIENNHAIELQELKDKAVITFKKYLTDYRGLSPTEKQYNEILECFITELNK